MKYLAEGTKPKSVKPQPKPKKAVVAPAPKPKVQQKALVIHYAKNDADAPKSTVKSQKDNQKKSKILAENKENKIDTKAIPASPVKETVQTGEGVINMNLASSVGMVYKNASVIGTVIHVNFTGVASFKSINGDKTDVIKVDPKRKYMLSSSHLFEGDVSQIRLKFSDEEELAINLCGEKTNVYHVPHVDMCIISVPSAWLQKISSVNIGKLDTTKNVNLMSYFDLNRTCKKNIQVSVGRALVSNESLYIKHNADTEQGWSGSPLLQGNKIVGVHVGCVAGSTNIAVNLYHVLTYVSVGEAK